MTDHDFDRTARAWLDDGPDRMPDRALLAALEEVHRTRQRRAWWPARRPGPMNNLFRAAAVAVVVAGVGLAAVNLLPHDSGGVGALPTPFPTPEPAPTPRALTVTGAPVAIKAGTYTSTAPFPVLFTATVPAGWTGNVGGQYAVWLERADGQGALSITRFDTVYADPCNITKGPMNPLPGPSVDDLAQALAGLPGVDVTAPTDITVDGYSGKHLTMTAPASVSGCTLADGPAFRIWELPLGATNDMAPGEHDEISILDVNGTRIVILSIEPPGQTAEAKAELKAVLDSLRFEPVAASPAAS
jgi:hypothetical protein